MPAKKKTKKKKQITKRAKPKAAKKKSLKAKTTGRKPVAAKTKRKPITKKVAKKKVAKKKTVATKKIVPRKKAKKAVAKKRRTQLSEFSIREPQAQSAQLSGDLQGLSRGQRSDSESVTELLEEGNTFEAEIVSGVEAADESEREVETHEVPADDVPGEYLDED